jgi:hypothetical protein
VKLFTRFLSWLLAIGALVNVLAALIALFSPDQLAMIVGLERMEFSYVWLGNLGMLSIPLALMTLPAVRNPERYRVYAWLITLARLLQAVYWFYVSRNEVNAIFKPFAYLWLSLGTAQAIVLLVLAEPEVRFNMANIRATLADWRVSRAERSPQLRWFSIVAFAGMAFNAVWIVQSIFFPSALATPIGTEAIFQSTIWLGITGVVLFNVTSLYLPAAAAPTRYLTYCWLIVASRVIAAAFWLSVALQPFHSGFWAYFASDATFGIALFVLLQKGAPANAKISSANVGAFFSDLADAISMQNRPVYARAFAVLFLVAGAAVGYGSWYYFIRAVPDTEYGDDAEHYKYAAVGLSGASRIPYYMFDVLPDMFPELLPDPKKGWASFGLIYEKGHDVPVGMSVREIGYKALEPNCALCHTASVRTTAAGEPVVIPGAPAHELDLEGFQWFLYNAATSPKFTTQAVMNAIEKKHPLGPIDRFVYGNIIVPAAQTAFAEQRKSYLWQTAHGRPWQGRGRTDTFNTTKLAVLKMPDDGSIGTTDLPQTWNQGRRRDMWLHWDGNNNSIEQRNFAAAMAIGATPFSVRPSSFKRVTDFLWKLEPAKFPAPIDAAKATHGAEVFTQQCASCHSWKSKMLGEVNEKVDVGTDKHRLHSFTQGLVDSFHQIAESPFRFTAYRKTQAYSNIPLDGIWARGPYLHHGAVPSLWDLLQTPDKRPKVFYRGYNVLDPVKVGFVSEGPDAAKNGFLYDTTLAGNSNEGHVYGTQLSDADKWALIEFLKTDDARITGKDIAIPAPPQQLTRY